MTDAAALRCPSCGAPVAPEAAACGHCRTPLHPVRCPWCFGWTFTEARDCARCGSRAEAAAVPLCCPTCRTALSSRAIGGAALSGCPQCGGVWADPASFRSICEERETRAAYLGEGSVLAAPVAAAPLASAIIYRPCAVCQELMNRVNFAHCSGVILDVCKAHGVWFDPDELRRIVAFIAGGGMDVARGRELHAMEEERVRLERAAAGSEPWPSAYDRRGSDPIASARDLLRFMLLKK